MSNSQLNWSPDGIAAKLRTASEKAAKAMGKQLKADVREGIRKGPKTGQKYRVTSKYHKVSGGNGQVNRHGQRLRNGGLNFRLRPGQQRLGMARLANWHQASANVEGLEYPANRLGKLLNSVVYQVKRTRMGAYVARVYSRLKYGKFLEEGTSKMQRRKLIRDTLKKNERAYRKIADDILRREVR